jgi:hypothetical protein
VRDFFFTGLIDIAFIWPISDGGKFCTFSFCRSSLLVFFETGRSSLDSLCIICIKDSGSGNLPSLCRKKVASLGDFGYRLGDLLGIGDAKCIELGAGDAGIIEEL